MAGEAPASVEFGDPPLGLADMAAQADDLGGKQSLRARRRIAVGLQSGDRLRAFTGQDVIAGGERRRDPVLQIGDAGSARGEPLALLPVLRDRDRKRLLGTFESAGGIAHLLV